MRAGALSGSLLLPGERSLERTGLPWPAPPPGAESCPTWPRAPSLAQTPWRDGGHPLQPPTRPQVPPPQGGMLRSH